MKWNGEAKVEKKESEGKTATPRLRHQFFISYLLTPAPQRGLLLLHGSQAGLHGLELLEGVNEG